MYNPDIHHRQSIRLSEHDYSGVGAYFVTVCIQDRECLLGDVRGGVMELSGAGIVVQNVWTGLPERFPHAALDEFAIMPNHFHGIIILSDRRGEPCVRPSCVRPNCIKGTMAINNQGDHKDRPYGTGAGSVGRIIQAFKSITTHEYTIGVNQSNWPPFPGRLWQRNYYERIIRTDAEMTATHEYIRHNPHQWADDSENPANHP